MRKIASAARTLAALSSPTVGFAMGNLTELCGGFEVIKSPDARAYRGHWKLPGGKKWPTGLIVIEVTKSGDALVFYTLGKYPTQERSKPSCTPFLGKQKGSTLTVRINQRRTATWKFKKDGEASAKFVTKKKHGQRVVTRAELVRER